MAGLGVGHTESLDRTALAGIKVPVSRMFVCGGGISCREDVASDIDGLLADIFPTLPMFLRAGVKNTFVYLKFLFIFLGLNFYVTSALQYLNMYIL